MGDTARLPYGTKSGDTVTRIRRAGGRARLMKRKVKMLVVACNTASAVALPELEKMFAPVPVIGVIVPGAEAAIAAAPHAGAIAIIATEGTVKGGAYVRAIEKAHGRVPVIQQACSLFVSIAVEEGLLDGEIAEAIARSLSRTAAGRGCRSRKRWCWAARIFPRIQADHRKDRRPGHRAGGQRRDDGARGGRTLEEQAQSARFSQSNGPHQFLATDAPDRFARAWAKRYSSASRSIRAASSWWIWAGLGSRRGAEAQRMLCIFASHATLLGESDRSANAEGLN